MILNDDECRTVYNDAMELPGRSAVSVTRAIEAAVIKRLAAGVSVEPVAAMFAGEDAIKFNKRSRITLDNKWHELVTLDQLTIAIAAARVQAFEDALSVCDDDRHANAIRELIGDKNARN